MKRAALYLCVLVALGGCASSAVRGTATALGALASDPIGAMTYDTGNLTEKNYAAADYLISRAGSFVKRDSVIKARPLLDVEEPRIIPPFAKQIPDIVAQRLIQLGYNVDRTEVSTGVAADYSSLPTPRMGAPDFYLSGEYSRRKATIIRTDLDVVVKLVDARTGAERAAFNYTLPRKGNVRSSSETKPVIFRTPE